MNNDEALIEGCKRGEPLVQKAMYERYASAMLSVCLRYTGNRETARDLLHDGFIKLFTKIQTYSGAGSFDGWVRKIFVTTVLEHLRRNDALKDSVGIEYMEGELESTDISALGQLSADDLFACLTQLPDGYRTVFNMYAIEGYPYGEIAKELGISETTARSQCSRARKMLQNIVLRRFEPAMIRYYR
jgi:RNA polymerase sigma-70 factor (ECF subfamily)